jgi:hypothetical protein
MLPTKKTVASDVRNERPADSPGFGRLSVISLKEGIIQ